MNILLVSPKTPETFWSFRYVLHFISKKASYPPLGLLTVAAMLPREWNLRLVDLNVKNDISEEDLKWADFVMLSAMIVQKKSVSEIIQKCQRFNKKIIAGGALFTTSYENYPQIQHFVLGEAENVIEELVSDLKSGNLKHIYFSDKKPDLTKTPIPRWDLIKMRDYAAMSVQFSRGCPFDCEFCDITAIFGRVPRTKSPLQLILELESLRKLGWKDTVFIVDDNFIGNKKQTRELLKEIILWRRKTGAKMTFLTEASVNLADDPELCRLMVEAGFVKIFVGIETPSPEALVECRKMQNQGRDLVRVVKTLQQYGFEVMGGFIVGFDNDPPDIFQQQFEFIQKSGVVTAMVGLLTVLPKTKLYHRLFKEGRITEDSSGDNTRPDVNFEPKLNRQFLKENYRQLMKKLYSPSVYYKRVRTFLSTYRPAGAKIRISRDDFIAFIKSIWFLGVRDKEGRKEYWKLFWTTLLTQPAKFRNAIELAIIGLHFRKVAEQL
ncbi:MAG: B12-binding domain-containing radical SAM protein [Verrucomicrobiia bacterium]